MRTIGDMINAGRREARRQAHASRKCRVCGCTQEKACLVKGSPCHWVEWDLCSACDPTSIDYDRQRGEKKT